MTNDARWQDGPSDLEDAERQFLEECGPSIGLDRRPVECPGPALLLGAEHNTLPEPLQTRLAAHVSQCQRCQQLLRDLLDAEIDAPTPEEARRIDAALPLMAPTASTPLLRTSANPRLRWLPHYATAASLALAVGLGAWTVSVERRNRALERQMLETQSPATSAPSTPAGGRDPISDARGATPPNTSAQINVDVVDLEPRRALRAAGAAPARVVVPTGDRFVTLMLASNVSPQGDDYTLEIRHATNGVTWRASGLRRGNSGTFSVLVPREALPDGPLTIVLRTVRARRADTADEYEVLVASR